MPERSAKMIPQASRIDFHYSTPLMIKKFPKSTYGFESCEPRVLERKEGVSWSDCEKNERMNVNPSDP